MPKPKISVNKLGEYLDATPARRRRIVQDQKDPKDFMVIRYKDAREIIVDFLSSGLENEQDALSAASRLRDEEAATSFAKQDKNASADAIEDFLDASDLINMDGMVTERVKKNTTDSMVIAGVDVSIRPDVIFKDQKTGGIVGALKLHFSKTHPLNSTSSKYVATVMRVHLEKRENSEIDPKKCYVVDVPTKNVNHAPRAYKKNMKDIEAACEEIEARWKYSATINKL